MGYIIAWMAKSLHTPEYERFCSLMVEAREKSGLTQTDVATRLGRPQSFVSKYESGERRLDIVEFVQVCRALRVQPCDIITELQAGVNGIQHEDDPSEVLA